ncbi:Uncharacterised protein [Mycobacteroides abscessus subsp. abscessus]|nr:Uncharacterised protein [Mycobacteroides abscessus subsp. abscessus]
MQRRGEVLLCRSQRLVTVVAQTNRREQCRLEVLLLVDDGTTQRGQVVKNAHDVRGGIAIDLPDLSGLAEILLQGWKFRIQLIQILVELDEALPEIVPISAQAFAEGGECGVETHRVQPAEQPGQVLEHGVDFQSHCLGRHCCPRPQ